MSRRKLNKQIQVYTVAAVADGFGGNTTTDTLVGTVFAQLETLKRGDSLELGVDIKSLGVKVLVNKSDTFDYTPNNMYFKYAGEKYTIVTHPEDYNFKHRYISFIAVKEK